VQALYNFIIYPLLHFGFFVLSFFNSKIKQGFAIRRNKSWITNFPKDSTWIWFHVASGELEYAKPVIRLLKSNPQFKSKILVTFFSPSVLPSLAKTTDVDMYVPMPWDTPWHWKEFISHYKPKVLAISRTDTWPNLVWQTKKAHIPSILFSATLPNTSGRVSSFFGRLIYESIFENITKISVVSDEDKNNFLRLSEELPIFIEGDTRFDQAISRVEEKRALPFWVEKINQPCVVAGSTWPEDEREILPAISQILKLESITFIIAPHEPTDKHLDDLERQFEKLHIKTQRYSALSDPTLAPVILVDKVGILAELYRLAGMAFVGGSFKKSIHSVMEPAASGAITFFGPYFRNNREAIALQEEGLAQEVTSKAEITDFLNLQLKLSRDERILQRDKILKFVQANKGVSEKVAQWILKSELATPHHS
jgi:3-deoxy-D-manno-octulosonic-acid transferase